MCRRPRWFNVKNRKQIWERQALTVRVVYVEHADLLIVAFLPAKGKFVAYAVGKRLGLC